MKLLFLMLFFISTIAAQPSLAELRAEYPKAVNSKEITLKLHENLSPVTKNDDKVLVAYKGAVLTLMAKFTKSKQEKKDFFKEGVGLIELAVKSDPENIEIRCIRLGVQENSPKFLGYHKNIEEDKQFILKNFSDITSKELKGFIKDFIIKSENFESAEKRSFQ